MAEQVAASFLAELAAADADTEAGVKCVKDLEAALMETSLEQRMQILELVAPKFCEVLQGDKVDMAIRSQICIVIKVLGRVYETRLLLKDAARCLIMAAMLLLDTCAEEKCLPTSEMDAQGTFLVLILMALYNCCFSVEAGASTLEGGVLDLATRLLAMGPVDENRPEQVPGTFSKQTTDDVTTLMLKVLSNLTNPSQGLALDEEFLPALDDVHQIIKKRPEMFDLAVPFQGRPNEAALFSSIFLANVAWDVDGFASGKGIDAPYAVGMFAELLEDILNQVSPRYFKGISLDVDEPLFPMRNLSLRETNKHLFATHTIVGLLVRVIRAHLEPEEGLTVTKRCVELAICTLLETSFLHDADDAALLELMPASLGLVQLLLRVAPNEAPAEDGAEVANISTRRAAQGLAHRLHALSSGEAPAPTPSAATQRQGKHAMVSYCWAHKPRAKLLGTKLRELGVEVWRDEEGSAYVGPMEGDTDQIMAEAVENSLFVIILVSRQYTESANCRLEAKYAAQCQRNGITTPLFVMLQDDFTSVSKPPVAGWLGIMVGSSLWYPCFSDDPESIAKCAEALAGVMKGQVPIPAAGSLTRATIQAGPSTGSGGSDRSRLEALERRVAQLEAESQEKITRAEFEEFMMNAQSPNGTPPQKCVIS